MVNLNRRMFLIVSENLYSFLTKVRETEKIILWNNSIPFKTHSQIWQLYLVSVHSTRLKAFKKKKK